MTNSNKTGADLVELAVEIASRAHLGQRDKAGAAYILRPLRLMLSFADPLHQSVAVLHDVLEDSTLTAADLLAAGLPASVIAEVESLTRCADESYEEFVERVAKRPVARAVKRADLRDNLRVERLDHVDDKATKRLNRYLAALRRLG